MQSIEKAKRPIIITTSEMKLIITDDFETGK
jgi:hypothetical protein